MYATQLCLLFLLTLLWAWDFLSENVCRKLLSKLIKANSAPVLKVVFRFSYYYNNAENQS